MSELISVTSETVDATFPELPRLVRLALGFGSKLQHGTLDVTLADGRIVRLGGNGPGPGAAMKISSKRATISRWMFSVVSVRTSVSPSPRGCVAAAVVG